MAWRYNVFTGNLDLVDPTVDHGVLAGLSDDDHTQYSLVDGTRAFTGVVAGITPTTTAHLTTKGYVDVIAQGLSWQEMVLDKDLSTPPGAPNTGDRYIVASGGTGAWSGKDDNIAEWNGAAWDFTVATESMACWVSDENFLYVHNGVEWIALGNAVDHGNLIGLGDDDHPQYLLNTGDTGTGVYDFGGASSFEIPNSATPTVDADGEIAIDTTVTDWSHGILKYYGGEEMGVVAMPIAEFTSPVDGYVVTYNVINDEFELIEPPGKMDLGTAGQIPFMQSDNLNFDYSSKLKWLNDNLGIDTPTPTARLHLPAGTATAETAPSKYESGVLLTTPEIGAFEFNTDDLYFGITTPLAATYTPHYPTAQNGTYVKATSIYSISYYQYFATDPSLSKVGAWGGKVWLSVNGANTNQRFHIDIGTAQIIKRVYYENNHTSGGAIDRGVRAFTLWGSNTQSDMDDLVYANDGTWVQLTTDVNEFDQHSAINAVDPKYVAVTNTIAYRYYAFKFATAWGGAYMGLRHVELQTQDPWAYRKKIVLDDGVDLVSGRVPYMTTNGRLISSPNFLFDGTNLTAGYLTLLAGTTSPATSPIKYASGSLMTWNEVGAMEYLTDDLYFTIATGDGTYTPQYPPAYSGTYVQTTTTHPSLDYVPWFATNPSLSLIGTWQSTSWLSGSGTSRLNNRFSIDLGNSKIITNVMYNNGHSSGTATNTGAKSFLMYGSNTASDFTDTSYGTGSDGDWVLLTTSASQFDQHVASNTADPKEFTVTNTTAYRYYSFRIANNWGHATYTSIRHIELQTSDSRKRLVMTGDETALISGDVPYVTTNGRLKSQTPVADGTYTTGKGVVTDGTITITNGIITAIQEASDV